MSRKGAKSRSGGRKLHSTGTKAKTRIGQARKPNADWEQQLESCRRELAEARTHLAQAVERETATSEVLRVISSSPGELPSVFNTILKNAVCLCEAKFGTLFRFDGEAFHFGARIGTPPELAEVQKRRGPFLPLPGSTFDRVMRTKQVCHTPDEAAEAVPGAAARLGGARSALYVPMVKDEMLVGAIVIYRQEVRPFTDKQVELVTDFAAQAVSRTRAC